MQYKILIPKELEMVAAILNKSGRQCWLVGGAVRDALLGRETTDFDLATDAPPRKVQKLFRRTIPTGIKHGTVAILMGKYSFETTTFRSESIYSDGRHPDAVEYTDNIRDDLSRRDFTINAIAWDIINKSLFDPFNGINDLQIQCIKAIGDPKMMFNEDALRILRACRLSAQLDFKIEPHTLAAIKSVLHKVKYLSAERIWEEIKKIFKAPKPSTAFQLFLETGLMDTLLPEMDAENQPERFEKVLKICDTAPKENLFVRAAAIFGMHEKSLTGDAVLTIKALKRLKASGTEISRITGLVRHGDYMELVNRDEAALRRYIVDVGTGLIDDLFLLFTATMTVSADEKQLRNLEQLHKRISTILHRGDPLSIKDLAVDGHTLMREFSIKPSPELGQLLNRLLEAVLDNPTLNTTESLLRLAGQIRSQINVSQLNRY